MQRCGCLFVRSYVLFHLTPNFMSYELVGFSFAS